MADLSRRSSPNRERAKADVTRDLVRTLAAANGLKVSEERLELVRREYENFLRLVSEIDKMSIPAEAEPAPAVRKP